MWPAACGWVMPMTGEGLWRAVKDGRLQRKTVGTPTGSRSCPRWWWWRWRGRYARGPSFRTWRATASYRRLDRPSSTTACSRKGRNGGVPFWTARCSLGTLNSKIDGSPSSARRGATGAENSVKDAENRTYCPVPGVLLSIRSKSLRGLGLVLAWRYWPPRLLAMMNFDQLKLNFANPPSPTTFIFHQSHSCSPIVNSLLTV